MIRLWTLWIGAVAAIVWYFLTDVEGGHETIARLQFFAWVIVAAGPTYVLRRALFPEARSFLAVGEAMKSPTGAGLVFLGLALLTGLLFLALSVRAMAADVPPRALTYIPLLKSELAAHWEPRYGPLLAGQIEQETCSNRKLCWNPVAELKTDREYGFGLGQLTVTKSFDNFKGARELHFSMKDWNWNDRFDAKRQLRTLVLMDRNLHNRLGASVENDRTAMMLAAYNGGLGGLQSDRRLCKSVAGCDPNVWFGHVELHSAKSRHKALGYGRSFYEINREYVRVIVLVRVGKYVELF